ncbi:MAG: thioredoxin domain-containing protein [Oscillospiraceae bacterium]|nr:thioredoxin domain-containing protein [Oscillospiraceae bacterium]
MALESFEDNEVADLLNKGFVSVKVDREERPDIDSIYMSVCQELNGSGGWPASIFMTPEQKPFFAGTYFPKNSRYGMLGFAELLSAVSAKWRSNRKGLVLAAEEVVRVINAGELKTPELIEGGLPRRAYDIFARTYDSRYGGFGNAPKFPSPHNLMFLIKYYEKYGEKHALHMAERTLEQMYKGGIFDHVGYGFSRYSTDKYFLAPHFEKMLYDNALMMICCAQMYSVTEKPLYKAIAEKTASYIKREMTSPEGAFYSAQDADSDGVEGKYYLFDCDEVNSVLGASEGEKFRSHYGMTEEGNFEGRNILNLLHLSSPESDSDLDESREKLYEYRKTRCELHLDDKILTSWNSLMIAAYALLSRVWGEEKYLEYAARAMEFIESELCEGDSLYVSARGGERASKGFIDDYAFYSMALIYLYDASNDKKYLSRALEISKKAVSDFFDSENGGFFLYGKDSERLITRPKDSYDGAMPCGNSVMAYNLMRLSELFPRAGLGGVTDKHFKYMSASSRGYAAGFGFFMTTLLELDYSAPPSFMCREDGTCS